MRRFVLFIFACVGVGLLPLTGFCHGVDLSVQEGGGIVILCEYNDGTPINYAETEVYPPDGEILFSSGFTDRNGRFCFFPDVSGEYKIVIQDGTGHRAEKIVTVTDSDLSLDKKSTAGYSDTEKTRLKYEKLILGLSLIFLLFGTLFWVRGKKNGESGIP